MEDCEMVDNLFRLLFVLLLMLVCSVNLAFAIDYEDKVSGDSNYSSSTPNQQNINYPASNGSTPSQESMDNTTSKPRSSKRILKDSVNNALASIIGAVGENIANSSRASARQGGTPNGRQDNQYYSRDPADQPTQSNPPMRRNKRITDY
jgi:hypothetical protein